MRFALAPCLWLPALAAGSLLLGCGRDRPDSPRESGAVPDEETGTNASITRGKVPVTTKSEEARRLYNQGLALFDQLRFHDSRLKFQEAAAKDPDFAMAHYQLGLTSPSNKEARAHVKQAVALSANASEGERLAILSLEAAQNANPAKALEYAKEAVQKYPEDERARLTLSFGYNGRQEYDKVIDELNKAIELNPDFSPAYNSLGYAYASLNRNDEAEKAFRRYIELVPNDPNPYDSHAELLMRTARFDESIGQYRKALTMDRHFTNAHYGIASNLMFQGKHAQAIAEAQKLADAARNDGERRLALFIKSVVYADQGKTDLALREMEKQYALDSKIGDPTQMAADANGIGLVLLETGKPDLALKRFQQALDIQLKSNLSADVKEDAKLAHHYNLGRVALARGDLATAKAEAAEYLKGAEAKENAVRIRQAHQLAGLVALREKNYDKAVSELKEANQQDPYVLYVLGLAYQGKGDQEKARELFKQAAESYTLPTLNYALIRAKAKQAQSAPPATS